MIFDEIERSNYDGAPAILYEFSLGTSHWRYTGAQNDITLGGVTYTAIAISHDEYSRSGDPSADDLTINVSPDCYVPTLFVGTPPAESVLIKIRTVHRGDQQAHVVWSGSVKSCNQVSQAQYTFVCNSLLATLNRNGLRLSWMRGCPHALYDNLCRANPNQHSASIEIVSLTGTTVTSPGLSALPAGYLAGGFLSFPTAHGTSDRRGIESHDGDTIGLLGLTDGMVAGNWITVYAGCNRTTSECRDKFNNLPNFGGFPHLPTKSPFGGDPVF